MFRQTFCNSVIKRYYRSAGKSLSRHRSQSPFFLTTPIFYMNDAPHIGHLYTAVLGDAIARWERLNGRRVLFSTGTDEHGLKVQQAAAKRGIEPKIHCDEFSRSFRHLFDMTSVSYDDFIRTTDSRHAAVVHKVWKLLCDRGYIYKGIYEGWYCVSDEAFLTADNIVDGVDRQTGEPVKVSKESGHRVEWIAEENYMFRLSDMTSQLHSWLDKNPVKPEPFERVVRHMLDDGLQDLSVSRPTERLSWGIPVPNDPSQTIYVWLDALINYLTVAGSQFWPADCHIVGKDILRFHAIYWPAFLIAADLPVPKSILAHSHWTIDHQKMSKSLRNVVDPVKEIERFSVDGIRYFLLRTGVPQNDGNYDSDHVKQLVNSDLVNTLGNLLNRCTGTALNPDQKFPPFHKALFEERMLPEFKNILDNLHHLPHEVDTHFQNYQIYKALECIMKQLWDANGLFQAHAPWKLKGIEEEKEWLDCLIHVALANLHVIGKLLEPVVPNLAGKIQRRLGVMDCEDIHAYSGPLGADEGPLLKRLK